MAEVAGEVECPFCGTGNVGRCEYLAETKLVQTTGLMFPRGEGRVRGKTTVIVTHRDGRQCEGEKPPDWIGL